MWNVDDRAWEQGHIPAGSESGRSRGRTQVSAGQLGSPSPCTPGESVPLLLDLFYSADSIAKHAT